MAVESVVDLKLDTPEAQRFMWVNSGEPHGMRRREILSKYGEQVRKLYGYDHSTAWQVSGVGENGDLSVGVENGHALCCALVGGR